MSHPSLDAFGDLDEAARDPHVTGCERCHSELVSQQQVRDLLASLPDPGPVPADVIDRIEATVRGLRDETDTSPAATVVPLPLEPPGRRRRPLLAVAAAAVLLAGGGFAVSRLVPDTQTANSSAAGAALSEGDAKSRAPSQELRSTASGTSYTRAKLASQVQQVMSSNGPSALSGPTGPLASASGIAACLAAIGAPQTTPLLVDVATFDGRPAAVVVLPADNGGREIWVVAPTCRPGADGTQFFTRVR